jgi:hypothetical protein
VGGLAAFLLDHSNVEQEQGIHGGVEREVERDDADGRLDPILQMGYPVRKLRECCVTCHKIQRIHQSGQLMVNGVGWVSANFFRHAKTFSESTIQIQGMFSNPVRPSHLKRRC